VTDPAKLQQDQHRIQSLPLHQPRWAIGVIYFFQIVKERTALLVKKPEVSIVAAYL
jgi:hypothetical protein